MRSIEDVIRIKQRQLEQVQRDIDTLKTAAVIMANESEPPLPVATAPGVPAAPPPEKRWP